MAEDIRFQPFAPGTLNPDLERITSVDPRLSRTHYFDGRLLKASDLTRDQTYLNERVLEIGRVLGSGIAFGLELALEPHGTRLTLAPGSGITPSGRVLELSGRTLAIDLGDSARLATLNGGRARRLKRGLHAVVLRYGEVCGSTAEAYPQDLDEQRGIRCGSFDEGVELALLPLERPLPQADAIGARAALVPELIGAGRGLAVLPADALPLGLLAVDNGLPQWLDLGLLRRPLRPAGADNALQQDLAAHYDELLMAVLAQRAAAGLGDDFAAAGYFRLLPPFGRLPRAAVDPVQGRQTWFPDGWEVHIAPIRQDDLGAVIAESTALAPMDPARDADADIMVLVPLSDSDFAWHARRLQRAPPEDADPFALRRLRHLDRLALRLHPRPPVHAIDTDADAWTSIWRALPAEQDLLFVRRPPRTAETGVGAVVLARGFELPDPESGQPETDIETLNEELDQAQEARGEADAQVAELERQLDALREQTADERVAALQEQVTELEQEVATLREQLEAAGGDEDALAQAQEEIRTLNERVAALESDLAAANAARDQAEQAQQRLQQELDQCRAELQGQDSALPPDLAIPEIAALRQRDDQILELARRVADALDGRNDDQRRVIRIAALVERHYDPALWPTLLALIDADDAGIERLHEILAEQLEPGRSTGVVMAELAQELALTDDLVSRWKALAESEGRGPQ